MEQEIQPQPQQPNSLPPDNKSGLNPALVFGVVAVVLIVGVGGYFVNKFSNKVPANNTSPSQTVSQNQETPVANTNVYFGKGSQGKYSLVNTQTGEAIEFIPSGYVIINQTEYQNFPTFLILQKDNDLYSYSVVNKITNSIFGSFNDLKINKDEQVRVYPSITEKDKFIIRIDKLDLSQVSEFDGSSPIISTRSYSFDASTNKLIAIATVKFGGCAEYDSKNQRFFTWPCGEGIGTSLPLSIADLNGKEQNQVITLEEFGRSKDDIGSTAVEYRNGLFFALSKGNVSKIVVLDPQSSSPAKETYTVNEQVKSQMTKSYPYSASIDRSRSTIIIVGDSFILLLRFDANKQITQSTYIPDKEIYANFIFVNDGKLFYQAKDNIRVVNLDTWQIEKSIPSSGNFEEITLFSVSN